MNVRLATKVALVCACLFVAACGGGGSAGADTADGGLGPCDPPEDVPEEFREVGDPAQSNSACGPATGVVARVVDGDTVELADGTKVRLIGVDTPETWGTVEDWGPEAKAYTTARLTGNEVRLEYDENCTDRFGRLLAYVYVDCEMMNLRLLFEGHGELLIIAPADRYAAEMAAAEEFARQLDRGLWGL